MEPSPHLRKPAPLTRDLLSSVESARSSDLRDRLPLARSDGACVEKTAPLSLAGAQVSVWRGAGRGCPAHPTFSLPCEDVGSCCGCNWERRGSPDGRNP